MIMREEGEGNRKGEEGRRGRKREGSSVP